MKISITNIGFLPSTITMLADASIDDPTDMFVSDFNLVYFSAGSDATMSFRFEPTTPVDLEYIAIGGHNFGTEGGTIEVFAGTGASPPSVGSAVFDPLSRNNVVMFTFPRITTPDTIEFTFTKSNANSIIDIANIQMGLTFDWASPINNSEPAGYKRPWIGTTFKSRVPANRMAQSVLAELETVGSSMSLSIPNVQRADWVLENSPGHTNMYSYLQKLSMDNLWYLKEFDGTSDVADEPKSSYCCFDTNLSMTANGGSRELNNMSLRFMAYPGI